MQERGGRGRGVDDDDGRVRGAGGEQAAAVCGVGLPGALAGARGRRCAALAGVGGEEVGRTAWREREAGFAPREREGEGEERADGEEGPEVVHRRRELQRWRGAAQSRGTYALRTTSIGFAAGHG